MCGRDNSAHLAPSPTSAASSCHGTRSIHSPDASPRRRQETFSSADRVASADERRHVLPKDLPNAVKHLSDEELDRLLVATLAEAKRRGRRTTQTDKPPLSQNAEAATSLTRGQLNAVHAAFQAGITPARIARQFGLSQSDVKKALATGAKK